VSLLDTFNQLTAEAIFDYIRLGQEEHLHLDFKTISNANLRGTDDNET
jgi:hypothetical protein